jgi:hypothetical protein
MKRALNITGFATLLIMASAAYCQDNPSHRFSGTVINSTNPDSPTAAQMELTMSSGVCKITISPPLNGSGDCHIKRNDRETGRVEIVSDGPPAILWSGTIKGNLASGTFTIQDGKQTGTFYLAFIKQSDKAKPSETPVPLTPLRGSCTPAIESAITGEIEGWDGETIFKLDNGEIWQQAEYDYTYFYEYHPDVTIYLTSSGCRMKVEGESDTVVVKRIK